MLILFRYLSLTILLAAFSCQSVFATAEFSQAYEASQAGDYKKAIRLWDELAKKGIPEAQYALGWMYESGQGTAQNNHQAAYWYNKAAQQGDAAAQYVLATMYSKGKGVTLNQEEAVKWFLKAANQGDAIAQFKLGTHYQKGLGVEQDNAKSFFWFSKSAKQGHLNAQISLGKSYQEGRGVKQDYKLAIKWFEKAASQGDALAQFQLATMYEYGRGTDQDYTHAKSLYLQSAGRYAPAAYKMGDFYEQGKSVEVNFKKAISWYKKAANKANSAAQYKLGVMYQNGTGIKKNIHTAMGWYYNAAKQNHAQASYKLGTIYEKGIISDQGKQIIPIDYYKAVQYYKRAVKLDDHLAYAHLAFLYENGFGVPMDLSHALTLYQRSTQEWAKTRSQALTKQMKCQEDATTKLFSVAITCTKRNRLDEQIKKQDINLIEEKSNAWKDTYFIGSAIPGTSELEVTYTKESLFAQAKYTFIGRNNPQLITKIKNQLSKKYGEPDKQLGDVEQGKASFQWLLDDGIELTIKREWPDTTTFVIYSFPENIALLKKKQKQPQHIIDEKRPENKIDLNLF